MKTEVISPDQSVGEQPAAPDLPSHAWSQSIDEVREVVDVDPQAGISSAEALRRLAIYGPNAIDIARPRSAWNILAQQARSLVVLLLLAAGALSLLFGDVAEAVAILVVVVLNGAIGFVTELKAVRSMEALQALGNVMGVVRRDGIPQPLSAADIVPGDIVLVEAGDIVPADIRLCRVTRLTSDESALTGESVSVEKSIAAVDSEAHIVDRTCILHKGSLVTQGNGDGIVVGTARNTEVGRIAELVEHAEARRSPLDRRLQQLGKRLIWVTCGIIGALMLVAYVTGRDLFLSIQTAIALAVAAIPEGLPVVATLAMARGMWLMAQRQAVVSRLSAVETLGTTTLILTDKTGTLTENAMTAERVIYPADDELKEIELERSASDGAEGMNALRQSTLAQVLALCSSASLNGDRSTGDPTEVALLELAKQLEVVRETALRAMPEISQEPFDGGRKMMATVHRDDGAFLVAVKGAPEAVLDVCSHVLSSADSRETLLNDDARREWKARAENLAASGLRVLAAAYHRQSGQVDSPFSNLTLLGLVGLLDPPRADVASAIGTCRRAGMRVVMVTGDHPATARHVAQTVGIAADEPALDAREFRRAADLSPGHRERLLAAPIIARCSPEQKLELIDLHQQSGEVVAMTGDGVNDAPALKQADIGIAMGIRGTAVAKQAATMVLLDDAFATIVAAVRYGRTIYTNIRRFVLYLMSCNLSEVLVVGAATLAGAPLPLTPLQILFLNLVTDVFPALALGVSEADPGVMDQPPRASNEGILTAREWVLIVLYGLVITTCVAIAATYALYVVRLGVREFQTAAFFTLALAQIWHVLNMRSRSAGLRSATVRNPWVWAAIALCLIILSVAYYVPVIAAALSLRPLPSDVWLVIVTLSLVPALTGGLITRAANRLSHERG